MFDRTDEAIFRASVPRAIHGFTVLEVLGYHRGGPGCYAYAYAVSLDCVDGTHCTHRIICQDDHSDGQLRWVLEAGHYQIFDRLAATVDAMKRAGLS